MKSTLLAIVLLACVGVGCVRSVHPFYTDSQLVFEPALLGVWSDSDAKNTFAVTGDADAKQFNVNYTDKDGKTGRFIVHLAKLERPNQPAQMIADLYPDELKSDDSDVYKGHLLAVHSFMLVHYDAGAMKVRTMSYEWCRDYLKEHPNELKWESISSDQFILTAPTDKLQAFILEHLKTDGAYGDESEFKWIKPAAPTSQP
jgi:hypothetical protein